MKPIHYATMPMPPVTRREWPTRRPSTSPSWCAVDLRDGNQALPDPMTPEQKREYFALLCRIGFKEIEIGFPAASADDFDFCRVLIEAQLIPADVTISVLTQARESLIARTFEAVRGAPRVLVHFYLATSELHRKFVFGLGDQEVVELAVRSARQIRTLADAMPETAFRLEFSPEEFTDTELDFAVRICDAVVETWAPKPDERVILNLPQTVERRICNEYADLIEEFGRRQQYPQQTVLSLHAHNDMGMAVAATMQGLMAGAGRVEGTLFGHGERTGNVDLMVVAMNLEYLGVHTGLDFSDLPTIARQVERITSMPVHARHPYAGDLVFTAFSGSHQDAIHKGLTRKDELTEYFHGWKIPYLHVAPSALGRNFERFIRINSQSGKGGIAHVLERDHRIRMPRWVQVDFAKHVQAYADEQKRELTSDEVLEIFMATYCQRFDPLEKIAYWPRPANDDPELVEGEAHIKVHGELRVLRDVGNGPISAFVHCVRQIPEVPPFALDDYDEETRGKTADAEAICFVRVVMTGNGSHIGVGFGSNIDQAAARAVIAGVNALMKAEE